MDTRAANDVTGPTRGSDGSTRAGAGAHSSRTRREGGTRRGLRRGGLALVTALLLVACGTSDPAGTDDGEAPSAARVTVTASSVVVGNPDAPQRVHVYQDLSCPHCQVLHDVMADDVAGWTAGEDVAVEFTVVDYLGPRTTHRFSTRGAGLLALVADVDPAAWPAVQEALFGLQPTATTDDVPDDALVGAAREAGAAIGDGVTSATIDGYGDRVRRATAAAAEAGVNYIPQVFVAGELVGGESHDETAALVREAVGG